MTMKTITLRTLTYAVTLLFCTLFSSTAIAAEPSIYMGQATPENLIKSKDIKVTGDSAEAARLINLFDRYSPQKAVVIPAAAFDHF